MVSMSVFRSPPVRPTAALVLLAGAGLLATLCLSGCKHAGSLTAAAIDAPHGVGQEIAPAAEVTASAAAQPLPDLPKGIDPGDLDSAERDVLAEILSDQFDPCGKPRSFRAALAAGDCKQANKLGSALVGYLRQGLGKKQAVALLLREIERLNTVVQIAVDRAPLQGPPNSEVRVIEFSDFECPFCKKVSEPIRSMQQHYGFSFYYKFFPLKMAHRNADGAARAAWAAHQQGRFWDLYKVLFEHSDALDWPSVQKYAQGASLDMSKFRSDFNSPAAAAAVQADLDAGDAAGADGTPTFFVNGRRAETLRQLEELVREKLAESRAPLPPPMSNLDLGEEDGAAPPGPATGAEAGPQK